MNGNRFEMHVSEVNIQQIHANQGVGAHLQDKIADWLKMETLFVDCPTQNCQAYRCKIMHLCLVCFKSEYPISPLQVKSQKTFIKKLEKSWKQNMYGHWKQNGCISRLNSRT